MSTKITKKRFIAGAVCPDCREVDRIVVEYAVLLADGSDVSRRRCVACGFADDFAAGQGDARVQSMPRGRPERPPAPGRPAAAQAVRILDPSDKADKPN